MAGRFCDLSGGKAFNAAIRDGLLSAADSGESEDKRRSEYGEVDAV